MTDQARSKDNKGRFLGLPLWLTATLPVLALAVMIGLFVMLNPLAFFSGDLPPLENLAIRQVRVVESGFELSVINNGPDPVEIAQVLVDDAYWTFQVHPEGEISALETVTVRVPYPWVATEAHKIKLITPLGATFETEVELAVTAPTPGLREFLAYGLLGIYVGIIPVALGMLWFPAMRRAGRKWLGAVLALTLGLLVFLFVDTLLEALEISAGLPGIFQGEAMVLFAALLTWLLLLAVGNRQERRSSLYLAAMIALGIGLHNLGEGLAIGAAFAAGEAALGSFLVIGFTLHNITEGVGIVAPLVPKDEAEDSHVPGLWTFAGLVLLAGAPAILGAWIGGFAYSPVLTALFLGIGAGAIWQVIVEVWSLLRGYGEQSGEPAVSWLNFGGFVLGLAIMYLTAFLVAS
ncbi:MAG: ZIP family metal transporter [Anaerolineales bacterium]